MPLNPATVESLRRVFYQGFTVQDIAEPLVSFDETASVSETLKFMQTHAYQVVGIRHAGHVTGYVHQDWLEGGDCGECHRTFNVSEVILSNAPLSTLIEGLKSQHRMFVSILGRIGAIVTKSDLQKAPVRMWLFGMVTLIEMRFTRLIEVVHPQDGWKQYLSASRIQKAEELLAERKRLDQHLGLIDCLQFGDKSTIIFRDDEIVAMTRFQSKRALKEILKGVERLRNNLAHTQDIIVNDWETIIQLVENLDRILEGPPGLSS